MLLPASPKSRAHIDKRVATTPDSILRRSQTSPLSANGPNGSSKDAKGSPSPQFSDGPRWRRRLSEGTAPMRSSSGGVMTRRRKSVSRRRRSLSEDSPAQASPRRAAASNAPTTSGTERKKNLPHYRPTHVKANTTILSQDSNRTAPLSFAGFRNLAMIMLIFSNLRLVVENYMKYGIIRSVYQLGFSRADLQVTALLTAAIPCHLFFSLLVERFAIATLRKEKLRSTIIERQHLWRLFAALHFVNAALAFCITSFTVYYRVFNPLLGTYCEVHSIVLGLKVVSYALTNRDLRDAYLTESKDGKTEFPPIPDIYKEVPYPQNLTVGNLVYFWWAPTLVYQPAYPRSPRIRPMFLLRQVLELIGTIVCIMFLSGQYALPILKGTLEHVNEWSWVAMGERLMKLATVSIVIWLLGFFALFQSALNILAELMRFADREFYQDWWNCESVGSYWKLWNKPVNNYFVRHLYIPLLKLGWPQFASSTMVFVVSAVLHEVMVGIPTHNVIGVAFLSMIMQIPLAFATAPLEKMGPLGATMGNCIFWLSFFLGQPLGAMLYYLAWNLKH